MSIANVRPSSLANIKRLANQRKKRDGIPYRQALNSAAQSAGFENYEHARTTMCDKSFQVFLTGYWEDQETFERGRESLPVTLSRPLLELVSKAELKLVGGLASMRVAASDHLVKDMVGPTREYVRDSLCKAARALRFMEMTGLRPCDYVEASRAMADLDEELPGNDHSSYLKLPASGQFILIDEPYSGPMVSDERAAWAKRNGWELGAADWHGLYFPYRCTLFVASKRTEDFDFDALVRSINALPAPVTAEHWAGSSMPNHDIFVSPQAATPQDKRRAKAKGTIVARPSRQTLPYHRDMIGYDRKPNGSMTLAQHQLAGRLLGVILQSNSKPGAVNWRVDKLMSVLVDWLYADVPLRLLNALDDPVSLYYGDMSSDDPLFNRANSPSGVESLLIELKGLLEGAYPQCAPLRKLTGRIDTALKITRSDVGRKA
ncbi:DUF5623 domain-containing protein [Blastomonas sp. CCH1-A6]|uniref:DUF5623 domain-containing protein n=1 Tax=Blastomonas sp. CCH1-A6 TaxID=1768762 RepID=UPI0008319872